MCDISEYFLSGTWRKHGTRGARIERDRCHDYICISVGKAVWLTLGARVCVCVCEHMPTFVSLSNYMCEALILVAICLLTCSP